jgi:succinate dehydrogenase/fumarate reductase flavoprotein subunit
VIPLEADIVVVGFGGAGAATALQGAELGASVIILEKQPKDAHIPSTRLCGGIIFGVNDVDAATTYLDACAGGMIPIEVSRAWAEKAAEHAEWLDAQGADLRLQPVGGPEHPTLPGAHGVEVYRQARLRDGTPVELIRNQGIQTGVMAAGVGGGKAEKAGEIHSVMDLAGGNEYFAGLRKAVEAHSDNIRVIYEAPAKELVKDESGRVSGVICTGPDGDFEVSASRGVVLTCGGYEYADEIRLNYLKASPIYFYGNPGNTGDGVRMAQAVGADLWHMNQMIGRAIMHFDFEDGGEINLLAIVGGAGFMITDKYGKRFANEQTQAEMKHGFYYHLLQYDPEGHEYPRIPCYWFFDSRRMANPLTALQSGLVGVGVYDWSPDNSRELERGWIKTADTIEELAEMVGIEDPASAAATLESYNAAAGDGRPDEFGRPQASMIPLEPPFYCVPLYPGGSNTCGGPRRNERAEVLDPFGRPIPGLYGAGELGESVGLLYPSDGGNLSESVAFGRIAAESAMATAPEAAHSRVAEVAGA